MHLKQNYFFYILLIYASLAVLFSFQLSMTEQESYYWLWSKNLDWGYFDHPPLQAWVTAFLTSILGDEKWVVRLPAIIGDLTTLALFYNWTNGKWGRDVAQFCSLLLISSAVFMLGSVIALPDSLAVPLGLAAIINAKKGSVYKSALFLGLALLSKWTVFFIVPGILYELYKNKNLSIKNIALFFLVPLLIQTPVILWNLRHHEVSWKYHLYERHAHQILSLTEYIHNLQQFILSQVFALGVLTFVLLVYVLNRGRKVLLDQQGIDLRLLFFWTAPGLCIVLFSAIQGQLRIYWTFLSLIPVIAEVGYLFYKHFPDRIKTARFLAVALIVFNWGAAGVVGFFPIGELLKSDFHFNSIMRHSPIGEIIGWKQWFDTTIIDGNMFDSKTALLGSDLHVVAKLGWGLREYHINNALGVAAASSTANKNQFQFWAHPRTPQFTKAIFFGDNRYDRISQLDIECAHPLVWLKSPVQVHDYTVKEIYWAYCTSLRNFEAIPKTTVGALNVHPD